MKNQLRKLFKSLNQKGNVLGVSVMVMFVLAGSLATITTISVQQNKTTSIQMENTSDENVGMRLIQQAISDFEAYIIGNENEDLSEQEMMDKVESAYNVRVENVTEEPITETAFKYRFEYTLNNGNILQMTSLASIEGATQNYTNDGKPVTPFNYSIVTNGDLIVSGGYFDNPAVTGSDVPTNLLAFYADNIYYNKTAPYWNNKKNKITVQSQGYFPNFSEDGDYFNVNYKDTYEYCNTNCWSFNNEGVQVIDKTSDRYLDIIDSGLETGNNLQTEISDNFFGPFELTSQAFEFITQVGPTGDRTIEADEYTTLSDLYDLIMDNAAEPEYRCERVWVPNWWGWGGYYRNECGYYAPETAYTNLTNINYDMSYGNKTIPVSGVYDGDLTVYNGIHLEDLQGETLIVTGDLTIDSNYWKTLDGKFVVLGDLIFEGGIVDLDGAFYVFGQTIFDFDPGSGINEAGIVQNGDMTEYGLTILSRDNIVFKSMWEDTMPKEYSWSIKKSVFDAFLYTEKSIYIEAVTSRVQMRGVLFANARDTALLDKDGNSTWNTIPVLDQNGDNINGIVINSYRGWVEERRNGNYKLHSESDDRYNGFYYKSSSFYQEVFEEIPVFDSVVFKEGSWTFRRSEFSYVTTEDDE